MVDVGAHRGTVTRLFASRHWQVHAFEPDPSNRLRFRSSFDLNPNVYLNSNAVGLVDGEKLQFYDSQESTGISSFVPFHESHRPLAQVTTVRLDSYLAGAGVETVDFLKVDTEGYDLFVLQSFGWDVLRPPSAVLCEFEDSKTTKVGYTTEDLGTFLVDRGYQILVSEWHPIERYGVVHSWHRILPWSARHGLAAESWGNLIAFRSDDLARSAVDLLPSLVENHETLSGIHGWKFRTWRRLGMAANDRWFG